MSCQRVPLQDFEEKFSAFTGIFFTISCDKKGSHLSTELSSVALGGRIVAVSDEFFAEASNLLKVEVSRELFAVYI